MRLFIAINFNEEVKDYLSEVQSIVKASSRKGRYTRYDNFHLTLRFLGELTQIEADEVCDILTAFKEKVEPFSIKIGDINSFQKKEKHIVYVDVVKNKEKLITLAKKLNTMIDQSFSFRKTYSFKPHITIGREIMFYQVSSLDKIIPFHKEILVNEVSLMLSSRNQNNVLTYTPIYTVNLNE